MGPQLKSAKEKLSYPFVKYKWERECYLATETVRNDEVEICNIAEYVEVALLVI